MQNLEKCVYINFTLNSKQAGCSNGCWDVEVRFLFVCPPALLFVLVSSSVQADFCGASSRVSHLLLVSSLGSVVFNSSSALKRYLLVVETSGGNYVSAPVFVLIERSSINGFLFF